MADSQSGEQWSVSARAPLLPINTLNRDTLNSEFVLSPTSRKSETSATVNHSQEANAKRVAESPSQPPRRKELLTNKVPTYDLETPPGEITDGYTNLSFSCEHASSLVHKNNAPKRVFSTTASDDGSDSERLRQSLRPNLIRRMFLWAKNVYTSSPYVVFDQLSRRIVAPATPFVDSRGDYNVLRCTKKAKECRWDPRWHGSRFEALIRLHMRQLLPLIFLAYCFLAAFLAFFLALASKFNPMRCIGGATRQSDFYFFTVETMFAIGFGSPRFPSCLAADWMVTPIIVLTTIFNSLVVGLLFAKFSGSHDNREPIVFSDKIVGKCFNAIKGKILPYNAATHKPRDDLEKRFNLSLLNHAYCGITGSPLHSETGVSTYQTASAAKNVDLPQPIVAFPEPDHYHSDAGFMVTIRFVNLTKEPILNVRLQPYLLCHRGKHDLDISRIPLFYTDSPLELSQLPISVTITSDQLRPAHLGSTTLSLPYVESSAASFEFLFVINFTDSWTSRNVEIRRSWRFDQILWNHQHSSMLKRLNDGYYVVDIHQLNAVELDNGGLS